MRCISRRTQFSLARYNTDQMRVAPKTMFVIVLLVSTAKCRHFDDVHTNGHKHSVVIFKRGFRAELFLSLICRMTSENIKNQKPIKTNAELFLSLICRMTSENIKNQKPIKTNAELFLSLICRTTSENIKKETNQNKC